MPRDDDLQAEIQYLRHALDKLQQRYENLFENAGDSIFIIDFATYEILDANENAARRLGYNKSDLIGHSLEDIEVIVQHSELPQLAWESTFSGTQVYECDYRHKQGHLMPVEVSSRPINLDGRTILQNFVREIGLRKQMEAEREELIADLDSFAHTVAHDLKNPLAANYSMAHFIHESWADLSAEETGQYMQRIADNSRRAVNIIDSLLVFASVRQQDQITPQVLDMADILQDVMQRLDYPIMERAAEITLPNTWHPASGYAPWVAEIWMNYLSNAVKYGGDPPRITLGSAPDGAGFVRFWVEDNGQGIPEDNINEVFTPFTRLEGLRVEGHGLGLSIVLRIVTRLGGRVAVESLVGRGSVFSFTLPAPKR